jgi:hypothetical protein
MLQQYFGGITKKISMWIFQKLLKFIDYFQWKREIVAKNTFINLLQQRYFYLSVIHKSKKLLFDT